MPYVTKEQIAAAKRMDLLTYLQNVEPQELVHVRGDTYCTRKHDSLKISNGKWCWWSRGIGGRSALDYLVKVRGIDFTEAVMLLCGNKQRVRSTSAKPPKLTLTKRFTLPKADKDNGRVLAYLIGRGIDHEILAYCIDTGRLYQSREFHNAVFVGFDTDGKARYAMLRGTSKTSSFMMDVPCSDKRYSFCIRGSEKIDTVHVFESTIDLLSYATLAKQSGYDWKELNYLSLGGVYMPRKEMADTPLPIALEQYLRMYPRTRKIILCLDNDIAGKEAAKAISCILEDYVVEVRPPKSGKDYNDWLLLNQNMQARQRSSLVR